MTQEENINPQRSSGYQRSIEERRQLANMKMNQSSNAKPPPEEETPETKPPERPSQRKSPLTPTGFFPGFDIKYPEYEVILPQSLVSCTMRSLRVDEEENLKASLQTPRMLAKHLNNILWTCMVKRPKGIETFDDFINKVTMKDREALVYGLYHITYKDIHNYDITCTKCETTYPVTCNINSIFKMKAYDGEPNEILNLEYKVKLPIATNVVAVIRQPSLKDELEIMDDILFQSEKNIEIATEMLIIKQFELYPEGSKTPHVLDKRENIFTGYTSLPASDRKKIAKEYIDKFGQFGIDLKFISTCTKCGNRNETPLDLVTQFFRAMYQ